MTPGFGPCEGMLGKAVLPYLTDLVTVAPKLRYGHIEHRLFFGKVASQFANVDYVQDNCNTPISKKDDPEAGGTTCISIEYSGQA